MSTASAFGYNALSIPLAAAMRSLGFASRLSPIIRGAALALRSVSTVAHALRPTLKR